MSNINLFDWGVFQAYINSTTEKVKYLSSPLVYRILYDKYKRPEIYQKIKSNKILNFTCERVPGLKNKFSKDQVKENFTNPDSFQEHLVYTYYETMFNYKIFVLGLGGFSLSQYGLIKYLQGFKFEDRMFIFLDNNRAIFNRLIGVNKGLITFMRMNLAVSLFAVFYFTVEILVKMYYRPKREEEMVLSNYKRSSMLYKRYFGYY